MKKIFIFVIVSVIAAGGAIYGYHAQRTALPDVALENLEALAQNEVVDRIDCYSSAHFQEGKAYTNCSDCQRYENWDGDGRISTCSVIRH